MIREKTTANETMLGEEIMGKFDATLGVFAAGLLSIGLVSGASADEKTIRIGVMNDMSGPYADFQGAGSVVAAKLAVEDYGGKAAGLPVEIISGDHLNKPDVGSVMAREWFDTKGVDAIADLPNWRWRLPSISSSRRRIKSCWARAWVPTPSPARSARPMRCNGPTTPMNWVMRSGTRWFNAAARPGTS